MKPTSMKRTKKEYLIYLLLFTIGILIGRFFFTANHTHSDTHTHDHSSASTEVWTCSMHPAIREDGPGSCPLCGMDLTPATSQGSENDYSMVMTEVAMMLAEIQTTPVLLGNPTREITLPGRISIDERRVSQITARVPGRLHDVRTHFTGAPIRKGDVIASLFSQDLITAQRELLEAYRNRDRNPALYDAAVRRFQLWDFSDQQIRNITESGEVQTRLDLHSPVNGFVLQRNAVDELYVSEGTVLFEVADLDQLWLTLEAYEEDFPWISVGDSVHFRNRSNPGHTFTAVVDFIDSFLNPSTRTLSVRAAIDSENGNLRPDMVINGTIKAALDDEQLMVPVSSVLWTGPRSLVYVRDSAAETPTFDVREVTLGPRAGDHYVIYEGVQEGELVVFHGAFRIDSEMQLADRFSMMNRKPGGRPLPAGHQHDQAYQAPYSYDDVSPEFRAMLTDAIQSYISGKDALVESDLTPAQSGFLNFQEILNEIGEHGLHGDGHISWMESWALLMEHLETITTTEDIEEARTAFRYLSEELIRAVHLFGVEGVVYHQYCPMAFDWDGASWLSSEEQIQNPYLPETMLMCGEVIERIE